MLVSHDWTIDSFLAVQRFVQAIFRLGDSVLVRLDELVQLNDLLLLVVHLEFVVELAKHLLLPVEAGHLLSQRRAEHFVDHFGHRRSILYPNYY